ncbi:hypothetical protein ACEWY4_008954 [Coilia grayii]|uniref:Uncharacterized protein n=1 Tax=Coilia grayii TaxID=363190 RepID=A0ABD1K520_9TELE
MSARGSPPPALPLPLGGGVVGTVGGGVGDGQSLMEPLAGRQMTQTHFSLPLTQGNGHHSSEMIVRVHHPTDTSVIIQPLEGQSDGRPPKPVTRLPPPTHKPRGRCFQETTPKQACSSNPLPVLTNQEDCCGSVGNSWGQNKCYQCPKLPYPGLKLQSIIEDYGSTCPQGYKRLNSTHCQDINECTMHGVCHNGECLNTQGSYRCTCKPGYTLDRTRCVSKTELGRCYRVVADSGQCELALHKDISLEICCCTLVGKAWGSPCQRCPQAGTASFSKICPAGKGMSYITNQERLRLPAPYDPQPDLKPPVSSRVQQTGPLHTHTSAQGHLLTGPPPHRHLLTGPPPHRATSS